MQLPAQLEAVEPPAKPSKPTVIKCCFKSQYFGVVGYTEVDAKTETDFDSKIVQTDGQGQTYEKALFELGEKKDPVGYSLVAERSRQKTQQVQSPRVTVNLVHLRKTGSLDITAR